MGKVVEEGGDFRDCAVTPARRFITRITARRYRRSKKPGTSAVKTVLMITTAGNAPVKATVRFISVLYSSGGLSEPYIISPVAHMPRTKREWQPPFRLIAETLRTKIDT